MRAAGEEERLQALQALALEGHEEALRQALSASNPTIQAMALNLLAERNHQEAVPLLQEAAADGDETVRTAASTWLEDAGSEKK
jgi:HEAT repeat protein